MTDDQREALYEHRDQVREQISDQTAITRDVVQSIRSWVMWGGTAGMVVLIGAVASMAVWTGAVDARIESHARRLNAAEVARETDRISTDMRLREIESIGARSAARSDFQAETMRQLREDMQAIRMILEEMRRPQGGRE